MTVAGITWAAAQQHATARLHQAGIESAQLDSRLLLMEVFEVSHEALLAAPDARVTAAAAGKLEAILARRASREPMAYILGRRGFWDFELTIEPGVLVPRPESETVVDAALAAIEDRNAPLRILDLGCGSGCLVLALLREFPKATALAVDIDSRAVSLTKANARALGLGERLQAAAADWNGPLAEQFDLIVSNPPYIPSAEIAELPPEINRYEERAALDGGVDGLSAHRVLMAALPTMLAFDAVAVLEIGADQGAALREMAGQYPGLRLQEIVKDLGGRDRAVILRRNQGQ